MTNATDIIGYTADADTYCPSCAIHHYTRFDDVIYKDTLDREGNPVSPIFGDAETDNPITCALCHEPIVTRIIHYGPESGVDCWCDDCGQQVAPCDPPCGPDSCTRRGGTILCRYDSAWWTPEGEAEAQVADDWYTLAGVTDGSDSFSCAKCGETIHPWYTRCEACGDTSPGTPPEPQLWTCSECGTNDYDSELDAERCCSDFYCHDCEYELSDLRESCYCLPDHLKGDYELACTLHHEHVVTCLDQESRIAFRNRYGQAMADFAGTHLD